MVIVLWRINFKCTPSLKDHCCRHTCYIFLSWCRDTNRVVEEVVVQSVHMSFVNALERTSIQCFQILSKQPLLHSFSLLQYWTRLNPLNNLWSFKSLILWWTLTSGDIASDKMLLKNLLLTTSSFQEHLTSETLFFRCFKL